jgi:3-hydroxybutyryl-CoA dehydrogenase
MGAGIAQVTAQGGYRVILRDLQSTLADEGLRLIAANLDQQVNNHGLAPDEKELVLSRISTTTEFTKVKEADLVIESVVENMAVKKQVFNELDKICSPQAILATVTSSLSITEIAAVTKNKERVLGLHFHNPVPTIELVEIIKGFETSDSAVAAAQSFVKNINKQYVVLENETPGYIFNRILFSFLNEAISLYFEKTASKEDIDKAMKIYLNMEEGPLALADNIGLDYLHQALLHYHSELKDAKYAPHRYFTIMVKAGHWGRKTGRGFYQY